MTGEDIKVFRARHDLSQTALCLLIGLERSDRRTVTRMEEDRAALKDWQIDRLKDWAANKEVAA